MAGKPDTQETWSQPQTVEVDTVGSDHEGRYYTGRIIEPKPSGSDRVVMPISDDLRINPGDRVSLRYHTRHYPNGGSLSIPHTQQLDPTK